MAKEKFLYKDSGCPVEERVKDLLSRMTIEEKVGQMLLADSRDEPDKVLFEKHAGAFLHVLGNTSVKLQKLSEKTRLGIPLIFGIDAIHGHSFWEGATIVPTQLAFSCSWDIKLVENIARMTAKEVSCTGIHWTFSPVICLARDLRWGRVGETFGEDPFLVGKFSAAMIRGYQGNDLSDPQSIAACAKHFAGYSETQGGRDASEADLSKRKMYSLFLSPFEEAVKAGCATFMTAYQAIDGVPCTANRWLLTEVLKREWGFQGFVVTDWKNIEHIVKDMHVFSNTDDSSIAALRAGNDMMMVSYPFYDAAISAVKENRIPEEFIDEACTRILTIKFRLGLFDNRRYPDPKIASAVIGCSGHRKIALDAARESIVLLKNADSILPLKPGSINRIAVTGPNADNPIEHLGDWSLGTDQMVHGKSHPREKIITVLDGMREYCGKFGIDLSYNIGCEILSNNTSYISESVEATKNADITIAVVGDQNSFVGEYCSTATLELQGGQQRLLEAIKSTRKPLIIVLINSKPLAVPWIAENADAVIEAWNPGMEGGRAVAEIMFGDSNPSGKLTISFPYHVGQQPVYYNQIPGQHFNPALDDEHLKELYKGQKIKDQPAYADLTQEPLYAFGFGLSFTSFTYNNLCVLNPELGRGEELIVEADITNTGKCSGREIAQLYINDKVTSATWPVKELKAFCVVELEPGETKRVCMRVPYSKLSIVNAECRRVVEPGEFVVYVGGSSRECDLVNDIFYIYE